MNELMIMSFLDGTQFVKQNEEELMFDAETEGLLIKIIELWEHKHMQNNNYACYGNVVVENMPSILLRAFILPSKARA